MSVYIQCYDRLGNVSCKCLSGLFESLLDIASLGPCRVVDVSLCKSTSCKNQNINFLFRVCVTAAQHLVIYLILTKQIMLAPAFMLCWSLDSLQVTLLRIRKCYGTFWSSLKSCFFSSKHWLISGEGHVKVRRWWKSQNFSDKSLTLLDLKLVLGWK